MKWYEDPIYIKMADCEEIQGQWKPNIGDYILRKYTVFGEPLDSQVWPDKKSKEEIIILHYHSDLPQYWQAVTPEGETRTAEFPDTNKLVKATCIFLPRQGQLQEMLYGQVYYTELPKDIKLEERTDFTSVFPTFLKFAYKWEFDKNTATLTYCQPFTSMEQLWLSFVMHELHSKKWDGDKWVSE